VFTNGTLLYSVTGLDEIKAAKICHLCFFFLLVSCFSKQMLWW